MQVRVQRSRSWTKRCEQEVHGCSGRSGGYFSRRLTHDDVVGLKSQGRGVVGCRVGYIFDTKWVGENWKSRQTSHSCFLCDREGERHYRRKQPRGTKWKKTKKKKEQKQMIKQVKCSFHQSTDGLSAALINTQVDKINKLKAAETFLNSDICNVMMSSSANCCYECACVSEFKSRSVSRSPLFLRRDVLKLWPNDNIDLPRRTY